MHMYASVNMCTGTYSRGTPTLCIGMHTDMYMDTCRHACRRAFEGHCDSVSAVKFSNDSQQLVSSSHDSTVRLWVVATGQCLRVLTSLNQRCDWSAVAALDAYLQSCDNDNVKR